MPSFTRRRTARRGQKGEWFKMAEAKKKFRCSCAFCKRVKKWQAIKPTLSKKAFDFVQGLMVALECAESDACYYNAILNGHWLQSYYKPEDVGETGREVIVKVGGKVKAKYLFCK